MPLSASRACLFSRRQLPQMLIGALAPSIATRISVGQAGGRGLSDRVNRFSPSDDAEQGQKQAVNRYSTRYQQRQNDNLREAMDISGERSHEPCRQPQ